MQQAEEAAAEAEAQRGGGFRLVVEAGVVQAQLAQGFAQLLEIVRVHRIEAAPHHRDGGLEARAAPRPPALRSSVMVSPTLQSATVLMAAVM